MFASFRRCNMVVIVCVLLAILLLVITGCGSTATTSTTPTATAAPTNTPTPVQTDPLSVAAAKNRFFAMGLAIKNKDYDALYSTTSMEYQNTHSEQQMISDIQQFIYASNSDGTDITDFSIGQITLGSRSTDNTPLAYGEMTFSFANGNMNTINPTLIAQDGQWFIADLFYHQQ